MEIAKWACALRVSSHRGYMLNAIGFSRESNPSRRIVHVVQHAASSWSHHKSQLAWNDTVISELHVGDYQRSFRGICVYDDAELRLKQMEAKSLKIQTAAYVVVRSIVITTAIIASLMVHSQKASSQRPWIRCFMIIFKPNFLSFFCFCRWNVPVVHNLRKQENLKNLCYTMGITPSV